MTYQELIDLNSKRRIFQICVVTKDLNQTIKDMVDYLSIGPWRVLALSDKTVRDAKFLVNNETMDNTKTFKFYVAICMVGDVQFELIQPVYGDTMYQRFIDSGREGLHHIKEKISMEAWDSIKNRFLEQGMKITQSGWFGLSFFAYFDTEPILKFAFEVGSVPDQNIYPESCELRYFPEE